MAKLSDIIDQAAIDAAMEEDDDVVAYKLMVAQQAVDYAKSIAPVHEGAYRDGIRIGRKGTKGVLVEFSDYKSHWIEFGTGDPAPTPEYAVRARTEAQFTEKR